MRHIMEFIIEMAQAFMIGFIMAAPFVLAGAILLVAFGGFVYLFSGVK